MAALATPAYHWTRSPLLLRETWTSGRDRLRVADSRSWNGNHTRPYAQTECVRGFEDYRVAHRSQPVGTGGHRYSSNRRDCGTHGPGMEQEAEIRCGH